MAGLHRRSFRFRLALEDQLEDLSVEQAGDATDSTFFVKFSGLRDNGYLSNFPGRGSFVFQHITSHFLPAFIGGRSPQVTVHVGDETREYPSAISEIVHRTQPAGSLETEDYGLLQLTLMECDKVASSDLKGRHFVHFIAHDRTVPFPVHRWEAGSGIFWRSERPCVPRHPYGRIPRPERQSGANRFLCSKMSSLIV